MCWMLSYFEAKLLLYSSANEQLFSVTYWVKGVGVNNNFAASMLQSLDSTYRELLLLMENLVLWWQVNKRWAATFYTEFSHMLVFKSLLHLLTKLLSINPWIVCSTLIFVQKSMRLWNNLLMYELVKSSLNLCSDFWHASHIRSSFITNGVTYNSNVLRRRL